jgi:hypothetical protein
MKKLLIMLVMCFFIVGCSNQNKEPFDQGIKDITGYIVERDHNKLLVVEKIRPNEKAFPAATYYTLTDNTVIFSTDGKVLKPSDLRTGTLVEMWHSGNVEESFPSRATATKITISDENSMQKTKAIESALQYLKSSKKLYWVVSVQKNSSNYEVKLSDLSGKGSIHLTVNQDFQVVK